MASLKDKINYRKRFGTASSEGFAFDRSMRSYDNDGHLHVEKTPISKANVCDYYGREIPGADELGLDPARKYKLYRHPEELAKAAKSSNGKPLLMKHVPMNADDHDHDIVVGAVGNHAEYKHPYLYNGLSVWTREAIDGIEKNRQRELSSSYRYKADMTPGITDDGEPYDGVMRDIDFNHTALVPEGRVGPDVTVSDAKPKAKYDFGKYINPAFAFDKFKPSFDFKSKFALDEWSEEAREAAAKARQQHASFSQIHKQHALGHKNSYNFHSNKAKEEGPSQKAHQEAATAHADAYESHAHASNHYASAAQSGAPVDPDKVKQASRIAGAKTDIASKKSIAAKNMDRPAF